MKERMNASPQLIRIRLNTRLLPLPQPDPVDDVEAEAHRQVVGCLAGSVSSGMTIAVGAGSRGIVKRVRGWLGEMF